MKVPLFHYNQNMGCCNCHNFTFQDIQEISYKGNTQQKSVCNNDLDQEFIDISLNSSFRNENWHIQTLENCRENEISF